MEYLIALFGSIIYNYMLFVIAKNNCDKIPVDFEYKKYFKLNWDNWGLTFLLAPVLVWYLPDIILVLNSYVLNKFNIKLPVLSVMYLGAGIFTELVLYGMFKLMGWKESWIAPVHK